MGIFGWVATIATALFAVNTAYDIGEKSGRVRERHRLKREQRRAQVDPHDVARELEKRVGGRVTVGRDIRGQIVLAVMRSRVAPPAMFGGFPVILGSRAQLAQISDAPTVPSLAPPTTGMIVVGRFR